MAIIDTVAQRIGGVFNNATVNTVYGEPRMINGVEVIPVAAVKGGFGMGGGGGTAGSSAHSAPGSDESTEPTPERQQDDQAAAGENRGAQGEGGGGGGGLKVTPVAVVCVKNGEPYVVPVIDRNQIIRTAGTIAAIAVFFIGLIVSRRMKKAKR